MLKVRGGWDDNREGERAGCAEQVGSSGPGNWWSKAYGANRGLSLIKSKNRLSHNEIMSHSFGESNIWHCNCRN